MEFLAGCAGGCAGVIVGHPLDTIKVKLQTQDYKNPKYKGTWDCFSKTFKQNGVRGLYRGISSPLGGVSAINAVIFGVHGNVHKKFVDPDSLRAHMVGGATAGIVQSFICSPVELAKTRLQLQQDLGVASQQKCKGPMDVVRQIYEKEGFRGVFRGQAITVAREIPAFSAYFLSFEYLTRQLNEDYKSSMTPQSILFAGGVAGTLSWIVSYPIDVIKSRIQSDGISGTAKYSGVMDCLRQSVRQEGLSVLTRGLSSTLIRAFPTNAATFFVVAAVLKMAAPLTDSATTNKEKVLEEITTTGEMIIQSAKETLDDNSNSVIKNIKDAKNYNNIVINNTKSVIANSEEIVVNVIRNIHKNYFFYDSYCNKMSLFNSNQILGLQ